MIDVVYNHTSPDSWLAKRHPEWFYHNPDGSFGNRVGEWYKGMTLLYAGQEARAEHRPSLFDKDAIMWDTGKDLSGLLHRMAEIKKNTL